MGSKTQRPLANTAQSSRYRKPDFRRRCQRDRANTENQLAGYSAVIDPWGNVLAETGPDTPALLTTEIDLVEIPRVREVVPSTQDRRNALYHRWSAEFESELD